MKSSIIQITAFVFTTIFMFSCQQQESKKEAASVVSASPDAATPKVLTTIQWLDSAKNIGKVKEGENASPFIQYLSKVVKVQQNFPSVYSL